MVSGPFRDYMGDTVVTKFVWVWYCLLVSSLGMSQSSLRVKFLVGEFMTVQFLSEDCVWGGGREFRKGLSSHLLFIKCLQWDIISIPKCHDLQWYVLSSCCHILRWHVLLLFHIERRPFQRVKLHADLYLVSNCKILIICFRIWVFGN